MQLTLQKDFYEKAEKSVMLIDGLKKIYLSLKTFFQATLVVFFLSILLLAVNLILKMFFIKKLKKTKPIDVDNLTEADYGELRLQHEKLAQNIITIKKISKIDYSKYPFMMRMFFKRVVEIKELLSKKYAEDSNSFEKLDSNCENYKGFQMIRESELREGRPSPYQYLL